MECFISSGTNPFTRQLLIIIRTLDPITSNMYLKKLRGKNIQGWSRWFKLTYNILQKKKGSHRFKLILVWIRGTNGSQREGTIFNLISLILSTKKFRHFSHIDEDSVRWKPTEGLARAFLVLKSVLGLWQFFSIRSEKYLDYADLAAFFHPTDLM